VLDNMLESQQSHYRSLSKSKDRIYARAASMDGE